MESRRSKVRLGREERPFDVVRLGGIDYWGKRGGEKTCTPKPCLREISTIHLLYLQSQHLNLYLLELTLTTQSKGRDLKGAKSRNTARGTVFLVI